MDPTRFLADVEQVPATLTAMADEVARADRQVHWPPRGRPRRLVLTGMGSSYSAAVMAAARLRGAGIDAVAELASAARTWPPSADLTVVAISASGTSVETLDAIAAHRGTSTVVALTNTTTSPLAEQADAVVPMLAGPEDGGVACRSYRHTIAALSVLEAALGGADDPSGPMRRAAAATADLLTRRGEWLPDVLEALDSPDGSWFLAPVERLGSAQQSALMIREGPRRRADACETGDWSHVDVYLTKTLDYRAVVFTGSRYDAAAAEWLTERGATVVAVGGSFPGARVEVRYDGEDDERVAVLTEVLVAELVAAEWWAATVTPAP